MCLLIHAPQQFILLLSLPYNRYSLKNATYAIVFMIFLSDVHSVRIVKKTVNRVIGTSNKRNFRLGAVLQFSEFGFVRSQFWKFRPLWGSFNFATGVKYNPSGMVCHCFLWHFPNFKGALSLIPSLSRLPPSLRWGLLLLLHKSISDLWLGCLRL